MKFLIIKIWSVLTRPIRRAVCTPSELKRLSAEQGDLGSALTQGIEKAWKGTLDPAEKAWVEKIEALRERLLVSPEPVEIMDFGAGSSRDTRTEEEMLRGTPGMSTIGTICGSVSKRDVWSRLLFQVIRARNPDTCLEMGCSLGLSCSYQAAALLLNEDGGKIVSLEGSEQVAVAAKKNWAELGLDNADVRIGRFADTLESTLKELGTLQYVFIDGHHDHDATLQYFDIIYPYLSPSAVVVFDDIYWTAGMRKAWKTIEADRRVSFSIDLLRVGIAVVNIPSGTNSSYSVALN